MNKEAASTLGRWLFAAVAIYVILSPKPTGRFEEVSENSAGFIVLDTATGELWATFDEDGVELVEELQTLPLGTRPR